MSGADFKGGGKYGIGHHGMVGMFWILQTGLTTRTRPSRAVTMARLPQASGDITAGSPFGSFQLDLPRRRAAGDIRQDFDFLADEFLQHVVVQFVRVAHEPRRHVFAQTEQQGQRGHDEKDQLHRRVLDQPGPDQQGDQPGRHTEKHQNHARHREFQKNQRETDEKPDEDR